VQKLHNVVDDLEIASIRQADAQDCWHNNVANAQFLQDQIDLLESKLSTKQTKHALFQTTIMDCYQIMHISKEAKLGIMIRYAYFRLHIAGVLLSKLRYRNPSADFTQTTQPSVPG
jgi:hypothetical protein